MTNKTGETSFFHPTKVAIQEDVDILFYISHFLKRWNYKNLLGFQFNLASFSYSLRTKYSLFSNVNPRCEASASPAPHLLRASGETVGCHLPYSPYFKAQAMQITATNNVSSIWFYSFPDICTSGEIQNSEVIYCIFEKLKEVKTGYSHHEISRWHQVFCKDGSDEKRGSLVNQSIIALYWGLMLSLSPQSWLSGQNSALFRFQKPQSTLRRAEQNTKEAGLLTASAFLRQHKQLGKHSHRSSGKYLPWWHFPPFTFFWHTFLWHSITERFENIS